MPKNSILCTGVIITNDVYIKGGLIFGFKLDVMSFFKVDRE
jgi:hypothetical protein